MEGKGNKRIRREPPESAWTSQTDKTVDTASELKSVSDLQPHPAVEPEPEPEAEALADRQLQPAVEPEAEALADRQLQPAVEPEAEALADRQLQPAVEPEAEALADRQLQPAVEPEAEALADRQLQPAVEPEAEALADRQLQPAVEPEAEALADRQLQPALEGDPQPQPEVEANVDDEDEENDNEDEDAEEPEGLIAAALSLAIQQSGGALVAYLEARRRATNPRLHLPPPVLRGPGSPCAVWMTAAEVYSANASTLAVRYNPNGLFVGRATHHGYLLPAIVDDIMFCCYVHWAGDLRITHNFEVLIVRRGTVAWMPARGSDVPEQAFPVGMTPTRDIVYVARVFQSGRWRLGRIMPNEGACVLLCNGVEIAVEEYEVLSLTL